MAILPLLSKKALHKIGKEFFRASPVFMFLKNGYGACVVQGCGRYAGQKFSGRRKMLCAKHRRSKKFSKLATR
jgi:hypothetical protein